MIVKKRGKKRGDSSALFALFIKDEERGGTLLYFLHLFKKVVAKKK